MMKRIKRIFFFFSIMAFAVPLGAVMVENWKVGAVILGLFGMWLLSMSDEQLIESGLNDAPEDE